VHSLLKFNSKEKFIWFCYLVIFITEHFTYFAKSYLFYLFFCSKNNALQYRSLRMRWVKSHEKFELWWRR